MTGRRARGRALRAAGVSLVELVVTIAVIGIAVSGVLMVFIQSVRHSADPMVQQQAVAVAEAYLDEILARPAIDPDGDPPTETRAIYDDMADYAGLVESPPRDQNGEELGLPPGYAVSVSVTPSVLGPPGDTVAATRVDVRVTHVPTVDFTLTGYRAQ